MRPSATLLAMLLAGASFAGARAQRTPEASASASQASLAGTVEDQDGALLPGARVEVRAGSTVDVSTADEDGNFHTSALPAGPYTVRVSASGFYADTEKGEALPGEEKDLAAIELKPLGASSTVTVVATQHDIATAQLGEAEKQRVLGIVPNFYVVYDKNPAPLSTGQKFQLAWRSTMDPVTFAGDAFAAGVEQAGNDFSGYGQGAAGYSKRFAAGLADDTIGTFLGSAILPSVFHQDPRYRYQGAGSTVSRVRHAVLSVFICNGDNDKLEFNYSNVLGTFASAGISNLYYPASDRHGAGLTLGNSATGFAFGAFSAIMQEFVVPKLTPRFHKRERDLAATSLD